MDEKITGEIGMQQGRSREGFPELSPEKAPARRKSGEAQKNWHSDLYACFNASSAAERNYLYLKRFSGDIAPPK